MYTDKDESWRGWVLLRICQQRIEFLLIVRNDKRSEERHAELGKEVMNNNTGKAISKETFSRSQMQTCRKQH